MATSVLVHGAWGGSYGFRTVRRLLAAAGHEALAPGDGRPTEEARGG